MADGQQGNSIMDEINAELASLSDEQIAAAALEIQARNDKARLAMNSPERKAKMRASEKKRRETNKAIMALAKQKGLLPQAQANAAAAQEATQNA